MSHVEPESIRAAQLALVEEVEACLARGFDKIIIEGRVVGREAAWAATQSLRKCWEVGGRYGGQSLAGDGTWLAHVQIPIARFPG